MLGRYPMAGPRITLQSVRDIALSGAGEGRARCAARETPRVCSRLGSAASNWLHGVPTLQGRRGSLAHRGGCLSSPMLGLAFGYGFSVRKRTPIVYAKCRSNPTSPLGGREHIAPAAHVDPYKTKGEPRTFLPSLRPSPYGLPLGPTSSSFSSVPVPGNPGWP